MNKRLPSFFGKALLRAALCAMVALGLVSCKKSGVESKPADVDYYTCTMHPSVHSALPGKCPICGMDLVPVKKKPAPGHQTAGAETNTMAEMPGMPMAETGTNVEEEPPSEFTVPVERQQQIGVTFGTVENHHFRDTIRTVGTVAYDKQRQWDYVTRVDGYVQKLDVFSPGEVVEKGAPLLTIYSPELYTAQKEFVNALTMRDNARGKSSADVLTNAEQLVQAGAERLRLWNISDDQIAELEKTRKPEETLALFSPFKGVVQDLPVEQGRRLALGDRVVEIADLSVVWVWAQFYQEDLAMLKKGLPVTVTTSAYPGEKFDGKIVAIEPSINDASRTARVRIDVENPGFKLLPDMYVNAELSIDMGDGLAVPVGAILPTGLHNIAFVDKGEGRLEPRFVELGREYGDLYEIKSGLKENERVVTSANFLIDAEAKVQGALKEW
ncbi:MAG TPA: efflux RND transporter periplasmic adaptor subunit [Candidatus Angelobacter sp.]|nr:efflux RND transporter periplasmic adaptor subunit [Candidatus Angelobacter sp.]